MASVVVVGIAVVVVVVMLVKASVITQAGGGGGVGQLSGTGSGIDWVVVKTKVGIESRAEGVARASEGH